MEFRRIAVKQAEKKLMQYRVHSSGTALQTFLKFENSIPLVIKIPYGVVGTNFTIVPDASSVGRLKNRAKAQSLNDEASKTLGRTICSWYGLRTTCEFSRIRGQVEFPLEGQLRAVFVPRELKCPDQKKWLQLDSTAHAALGFNDYAESKLWRKKIELLAKRDVKRFSAIQTLLQRILARHPSKADSAWEKCDIEDFTLALSYCGCSLGKPADGQFFPSARFKFGSLPPYRCAVEVHRSIQDFKYKKYYQNPLPRAVVFTIREQPAVLPQYFEHVCVEHLLRHFSNRAYVQKNRCHARETHCQRIHSPTTSAHRQTH